MKGLVSCHNYSKKTDENLQSRYMQQRFSWNYCVCLWTLSPCYAIDDSKECNIFHNFPGIENVTILSHLLNDLSGDGEIPW